jgi:peptidoglycan-associated lipoprotein
MRRNVLILLVAVMCLAMVAGCATTLKPIPAQDLSPKLKSGALVQKTNNFEMILDTSASMDEAHSWMSWSAETSPDKYQTIQSTKLEYMQQLAQLFNDTIPPMKLTAGMRDFAGKRWLTRNYDTKLWYGMAPWVKEDLGKAIFSVNTYGVESPLDSALDAATMDLKPLAGKSAVIIFTDGLDMPKAVASAQAMKAALRDNVCIYAVQIGKDRKTMEYPQGEARALLDKVVKAGECGVLVTGEEVSTPAGMAAFVEKVFLGPPPPPPPPPPAPVVVPPVVPAPAGPEKLEAIYFDFDKYVIKPEFRDALKRNADWLQQNPGAKVVVEGNCDERGTNEYNMALGQRRADAAAKYLMDLGVAKDRIGTVSYGEEKPICTEKTESCWSKNRRDDFVVK